MMEQRNDDVKNATEITAIDERYRILLFIASMRCLHGFFMFFFFFAFLFDSIFLVLCVCVCCVFVSLCFVWRCISHRKWRIVRVERTFGQLFSANPFGWLYWHVHLRAVPNNNRRNRNWNRFECELEHVHGDRGWAKRQSESHPNRLWWFLFFNRPNRLHTTQLVTPKTNSNNIFVACIFVHWLWLTNRNTTKNETQQTQNHRHTTLPRIKLFAHCFRFKSRTSSDWSTFFRSSCCFSRFFFSIYSI